MIPLSKWNKKWSCSSCGDHIQKQPTFGHSPLASLSHNFLRQRHRRTPISLGVYAPISRSPESFIQKLSTSICFTKRRRRRRRKPYIWERISISKRCVVQ